jgi:hypothetical protein
LLAQQAPTCRVTDSDSVPLRTQMALFYAPAFFAHLLGRCLAAPRPVLGVARLGVAVVGTMLLVWAPLLRDPGPLAVAARLAPIGRGVFEDWVASLWCATSPFIKWRARFAPAAMARAAAALSIAACVPSMAQQIARPSGRGLLFGMMNSALAAFLLGFQASPSRTHAASLHRSRFTLPAGASRRARCTKSPSCCRCCPRRCWR